VFAFSMQAEQSIVVDPKSPGGINSPHGLILLDGVCVLCSRGCSFVSKRDRRDYFRFAPMQLAEGRPLAEQLGINPDRPDSFAFVANGQAYVKSEAVLRIARELPHWQWTWLFHFVPRVIRDAIYELVARNRYRWFGRRDVASCRIRIVRGHRKPPRDCQLIGPIWRKTMEWFSRKTSIAGMQISNWMLVIVAVVVIWIIYKFIAH